MENRLVSCPQCDERGIVWGIRGRITCPLCKGECEVSEEVSDAFLAEQRDIAADRKVDEFFDNDR